MSQIELSSGFRFLSPFPSLYLSERRALQSLHQSATSDRSTFVGEAKMSGRLTLLLLCWMIAWINSEDQPRTVFMVCKSEERRKELMNAAEKIRKFMGKKAQEVRIYGEPEEYERELEEGRGARSSRRLWILCVRRYLEEQLSMRERTYWQKQGELGRNEGRGREHFHPNLPKIDFLFLETNDLESLLEEVLTLQISQLHIFRAALQSNKLQKFYNFRFEGKNRQRAKANRSQGQENGRNENGRKDKSKVKGGKSHGKGEKLSAKPDRDDKVESIDKVEKVERVEKEKEEKKFDKEKIERAEKADQVQKVEKAETKTDRMNSRENQQQTKIWRVQQLDSKFKQLVERKQKAFGRQDPYGTEQRALRLAFSQCYSLLHLQTVFYLLNFLIKHFGSRGQQPDDQVRQSQTAEQFLRWLAKSTHLTGAVLRKLCRFLHGFIAKYPPRLCGKQLSTFYLQQVLTLFEKLVVWHEMFEGAEDSRSGTGRLLVLRGVNQREMPRECGKVQREQQLTLTSFDRRLLAELLTDGVKGFCCFQGHGYAPDYFNEVFKHTRLVSGSRYISPSDVFKGEHKLGLRRLSIGLLVNSTPNDEDLHLVAERAVKEEVQLEERQGEHYWQIVRAYGVLIHDLCEVVADGLVVYFPTRELLKECRAEWESKESIYERIYHRKMIFQEGDLQEDNRKAVSRFRKLCGLGRGAVFFLSAQSQFSKYQTFLGHYSRCVVFVGLPYPSSSVQATAKFRQLNYKNHEKGKFHLFCFEQAMRGVARCLTNCLGDPMQCKFVVFADAEFRSEGAIQKWFPFIEDGPHNTSTVIERVLYYSSRQRQMVKEREHKEAVIEGENSDK